MPDEVAPDWMDKTGYGVIGRFTLIDGQEITAEIVDYNEEANELIVQPTSVGDLHGRAEPPSLAIAVDSVRSFDVEARSSLMGPHSDPCRTGPFSGARLALMTTLFVSSTAGSLTLFIVFMNGDPYRLQELSLISYTAPVVFLTFAATRENPSYLFSCPAVTSQIPKLLLRHVGFLLTLFLVQTATLAVRPSLPEWWSLSNSRGETPFETVLLFLSVGVGLVQVYTNRALLQRAHSEFTG